MKPQTGVLITVTIIILYITMFIGMSQRIDMLVEEHSACKMMGGTPIATNKGYSCYIADKITK